VPIVVGYIPVMMPLREGAQTGAWVKTLENRTPEAAK
jgi:hypothetical protein